MTIQNDTDETTTNDTGQQTAQHEHFLCARVNEDYAGARLDAALLLLFPQFGLRARRRIIDVYGVTCNGRPARAASRVRAGDDICVNAECAGVGAKHGDEVNAPTVINSSAVPNVLNTRKQQSKMRGNAVICFAQNEHYAALSKPCGLHSARILGSSEDSAEAHLAEIFTTQGENHAGVPILVNRLDKDTSGILLAAFGEHAAAEFRCFESAGLVNKYYCAVVEGRITTPFLCKNVLNTDNRRVTRVYAEESEDATRWTQVFPVAACRLRESGQETGSQDADIVGAGGQTAGAQDSSGQKKVCKPPRTLVLVRIKRGARHQIRAHLAHAGYPLANDALYTPQVENMDRQTTAFSVYPDAQAKTPPKHFYLHHCAVELPNFIAEYFPQWERDIDVHEKEAGQEALENLLRKKIKNICG